MLKPAPGWQYALAYMLIALTACYLFTINGHDQSREQKVTFSVIIGLGFGGALFVVRRRRGAELAWVALILYGLLILLAVVGAVINSMPIE